MERFYSRPITISPRVLGAVATAVFALLLLPLSGWFLLLLAPFVTHIIVGFRLTQRRVVLRACLVPTMMLLPLILAAWINSHQRVSYCLASSGGNQVTGIYLFPGVVETGVYEHDPAGLKYLREGITDDIADVMTEDVRRFQTFENSEQVYDCICLSPRFGVIECRIIPVIDGWGSVGSVYAGIHGRWINSSFYINTGTWTPQYAYSSFHVGFHFIAPCLITAVPYALGVRRWRRHEYRLRMGLCVGCGYDLRGTDGYQCSECGTKIENAGAMAHAAS